MFATLIANVIEIESRIGLIEACHGVGNLATETKRMNTAERYVTIFAGLVKRYGPSGIKKVLWDKEFSGGHWDFIDETSGDCVYPYLERHAKSGSILDLGCGPGNTANELAESVYGTYLGVDISEAALAKATRRTIENGRAGKNRFLQGDFINYVPSEQFDIILFRESTYHVPLNKLKSMLDRYSNYLKDGGVFVVRMVTWSYSANKVRNRLKSMVDIIEAEFDVVEKGEHGNPAATVIAFRPRRAVKTAPEKVID